MRKLYKIAAATFAVAAVSLLAVKSDATPRSAYCDMVKSQRNPVSGTNSIIACKNQPPLRRRAPAAAPCWKHLL